MTSPIRCVEERDGQVRRIVFDRPPGNILDREMFSAIRREVGSIGADPRRTKLLVFEGAGANFSFGASVEEHLPDRVGEMLALFRATLVALEEAAIPTAALVRGQCLGGGLELAAWCGRIFCDASARFAVPEIKLAVFPPIASIALPERIGRPAALQMILSGSSVEGPRAAEIGLVDECVPDPESALSGWFAATLESKSAVAVRMAWKAARRPVARALETELPDLERIYLEELMVKRDPQEGLRAFLEKRKPVWEDR